MAATTWTLNIPGWRPCSLNDMTGYWGKRHKIKAKDRDVIGLAVLACGIPKAIGKRRVDLLVVYPKGARSHDPDAFFKSANDALVHSGALRDDTKNYVELGSVEYAKGEVLRTVITLTDLD